MDPRLLEASQTGNIDYLHQLLRENPLILHGNAVFSADTPLHVASIAGHPGFVKEILMLKPEFAKEMNQDGFSPMHMAAAKGNAEIVRELVKLDSRLCRLEGKDKKTPLHFATIRGRVEVISAMLLGCPDCIEDLTLQEETALHLAVKNNKFEATKLLVEWIREQHKEDLFNVRDEQGNTVLHLSAWKKQRQVTELLVGNGRASQGSLDVNAINHAGLTALDVLQIFPSESGDREISDILRDAGAMRAKEISPSPISPLQSIYHTVSIPSTPQPSQSSQPNNFVDYFKFKKGRDSPSEARSTLLVIAVLVATSTFQVGVNPPGGVWQDTYVPDKKNSTGTDVAIAHYAGESVLATSYPISFALFALFNSIGFSVSLFMINVLTARFPLQFELQICIVALFFCYNTALTNLVPNKLRLYVILVTAILPALTSGAAKLVRLQAHKIKEIVMDAVHKIMWILVTGIQYGRAGG